MKSARKKKLRLSPSWREECFAVPIRVALQPKLKLPMVSGVLLGPPGPVVPLLTPAPAKA